MEIIIISPLAIFVLHQTHQFVNKIDAGVASSATARTTVDQVTHSDCNNF